MLSRQEIKFKTREMADFLLVILAVILLGGGAVLAVDLRCQQAIAVAFALLVIAIRSSGETIKICIWSAK